MFDICSLDGNRLEDDALDVKMFRDSTLTWSRQVRPRLGDRKVWQKYLGRLCFNQNHLMSTLGR